MTKLLRMQASDKIEYNINVINIDFQVRTTTTFWYPFYAFITALLMKAGMAVAFISI